MRALIRLCGDDEMSQIYKVVNDSAQAYKGVIPADRWHEPYMSQQELEREVAQGVGFWGCWDGEELLGVMGMQDVGDVTLIRHAYVRTARRGQGIGGRLLAHLCQQADRPLLIGTWADAVWAIRFYQKYGFQLVSNETKAQLLGRYWDIPERQIETSVVLANQEWMGVR